MGVILELDTGKRVTKSFPRMRGGDPLQKSPGFCQYTFSPHARGGNPRVIELKEHGEYERTDKR